MKRFCLILLSVLMCVFLIVSCEPQKPVDEVVNVNVEITNKDDLSKCYWRYTAVKTDTTGFTTGEKREETPLAENKNLSLSTGEWKISLFGYENDSYINLLYKGEANVSVTRENSSIKVPVVGEYPAKIGDSYYENAEEALKNIDESVKDVTVSLGKSNLSLESGIFNAGNKSKNITFVGELDSDNKPLSTVNVAEKAVSAEGAKHLNYQRGSSFTFENLTIQAGTGDFDGIVCDELTYKNCTIKGKLTLYGKATFINCTFENDNDDDAIYYSIWTWGGTDVKFEGCTFNTKGKAINLYGQATAEKPTNLTVNNCTFNDRNNGTAGKAAIEIGNDYNATYTLTINNATVNGFAEGENTGSKLWANKNSMDKDHLSVTINGTKVL